MTKIQITTPGIRKALRQYKYPQAIAEYIWNGFDAKANIVELNVNANEIGHITELRIKDNGYGIPINLLNTKFKPFFESDKEIDPNQRRTNSAVHGKNGVGRLTFFHFASIAQWKTVYSDEGNNYTYDITITSDKLDSYHISEPEETDLPTGTTVIFTDIPEITSHNINTDVQDFLKQEFSWFLELNEAKGFSIKTNNSFLDHTGLIGDKEVITFKHKETETVFEIKYIRWNTKLNNEYSRYYFIQSNNTELFKETTTLNNKGDYFYHSVFIKSSFFDKFVIGSNGGGNGNGNGHQQSLLIESKQTDEFKFLMKQVNRLLKQKRKPFLKEYTDKLILDLESNNAFPDYNTRNSWERLRKNELEHVVREMFQVEPRIFHNLNVEQKKTLIRLLDLIMDSDKKDQLFDILNGIVELEEPERKELATLLQTTRLSRIIRTIKLIQDRYRAIAELNELIFNKAFNANEVDHLQKFVEKHYWIFGEQYHLVTAAEPKFEEALRRHSYLLRGEKEEIKIDHPDKNKEMDIFMVRWDKQHDIIKNVVIELKHPHNVKLGEKELQQVKRYFRVIFNQPEFNAHNMSWEFYLVGTTFDTSGYIEGELENAKNHGEQSLVYKKERYKIYVKTWREIFTDFELRHSFLNKELELERDRLLRNGITNADKVIENIDDSYAIQEQEISIPD